MVDTTEIINRQLTDAAWSLDWRDAMSVDLSELNEVKPVRSDSLSNISFYLKYDVDTGRMFSGKLKP